MTILSLGVFFILGFILACLLTAPRMHELETELWELRRKLGRSGMKYVCNGCQGVEPCKLKIKGDADIPTLCPFSSVGPAKWEREEKKLTTTQCQHPAQQLRVEGAKLTCSLCGKSTELGIGGQWSEWA